MSNLPRATDIVFYTQVFPYPRGSGMHLRVFSDLRACVDLGAQVEVVYFSAPATALPELHPDLQSCRVRLAAVVERAATVLSRLSYRASRLTTGSIEYVLPGHASYRETASQMLREHPRALHYFEGAGPASAIPFIADCSSIWSLHDVPSAVTRRSGQIDRDIEGRGESAAEQRECRLFERLERTMAKRAKLVICASTTDLELLRRAWGVRHAEHLPMSVIDETAMPKRSFGRDEVVRLLHLGGVAHLPAYRSLEFLLLQVLPRLSPEVRARIELSVAGTLDREHPRCLRILELAQAASEVRFLGFVDDLDEAYRSHDLQVIGATDGSGLRTRVIESWAKGLPVLSTRAGSASVAGVEHGVNILESDDADQFAKMLSDIVTRPEQLESLAREGRATYDRVHARIAVRERLRAVLSERFGYTATTAYLAAGV